MASYGTQEVLVDVPEVTFVGTKRPIRTNCVEENELLNGSGSRTSIKRRDKHRRSDSLDSENDLIEYLKGSSYHSCADSGVELKEMQDAPFDNSRAGSEEDILEYEDTGISCHGCSRKRRCTSTEKSLILFGVICLIVIIALAVAIGKKKPEKEKIVCESEGCLRAASSIIGAMDTTEDPCYDFHQYACGGWLKETPIPPGYPVWDRFQELSHKNLYMLKNFIETHTLHGKAQTSVRRFYDSCMDESKISREETLTDFDNLLTNISSEAKGFNLLKTLVQSHRLAIWPLFQVLVEPDERNPENNIIKIEAGASPFPFGLFKDDEKPHEEDLNERPITDKTTTPPTSTVSPTKVIPSFIDLSNGTNNNNTEYNIVTNSATENSTKNSVPGTTEQPHIKETHPHPVENVSDLVEKYLFETKLLLVSLWKMGDTEAHKEAQLIFQLEKRLSVAHDINLHIHNRKQAYNAMKVTDLQLKCTMINWYEYLKSMFGSEYITGTEDRELIVLHETALRTVCSIVNEYNNNSTLRPILRKYILLNVVRSLKPYFDMNTFQIDINPDEVCARIELFHQSTLQEIELQGEHWRRCTFYANKAFGYATGSIYVNATASAESLTQVRHLVEYVKRAFKDYLLRKIWLDPSTKSHAAAKIDEMIEKVSYPLFIMNTTFLDGYYEHFVVGKDWFQNLLNWRKFVIKNMVKTLSQKFDRQKSWINPPVTVESDYSPVRNDIIFPIALFHLPIFSPEGPSALNFGAIGSLIGHEITHAFDIQGRQYDGYGRLRDWWDPVTADMFNTTTQCMIDQYDHFTIGNMTINGEQTLEENIADNGGLRAAYIIGAVIYDMSDLPSANALNSGDSKILLFDKEQYYLYNQKAYELWMKENGEEAPLPGVSLTNKQIFYISFAQLYCSKWKESGIKDFLMRDTHSPGPFRIQGALSNSLAFQDIFQCSNLAKYNPPIKCQVW